MSDERRQEGIPFDRLTALTADMTDVLEAKGEEVAGVRCVVFLMEQGPAGKTHAGLQMWGYEDDTDAVADVLIHLQAIFRANGKTLIIAPLNEG